jgi:hypothetical protein
MVKRLKTSKNLRSSEDDKFKEFKGNVLRQGHDVEFLKRRKLIETTTLRRARYWCYRIRTHVLKGVAIDDAPKKFKEFIESLPGFSSWEKFASTWDIVSPETNYFMIVHRVLSVWQEWEHVMDRVAVPIDAPPEEIQARVAALTKDFARKYGG